MGDPNIKASFSTHDFLIIRGRKVNIYNSLKRAKNIVKMKVKNRFSGVHMLVSHEVYLAIKAYGDCDGFADLSLHEYLDRVFLRPPPVADV